MAVLIKATGDIQEVSPKNGKTYSLEELQGYVAGSIELVYLKDDEIAVVNEEGLWGLPYNSRATVEVRQKGAKGVVLFGDVIICKDNEIE